MGWAANRASTWWWLAPVSPACTCCIGCGRAAFRCACSRPAETSAAPGTGTAIRAHAATWRAWSTPTASTKPCSRSGRGRNATPGSRKSCATPTTWRSASICGATSSSTPAWSRRCSTKRPAAGASAPMRARASPRSSASWPRVASPPPTCRSSRAATASPAPPTTPGVGPTRKWISPASASASLAPDRRPSRPSPSSLRRRGTSPCSNARPTTRFPRATGR